MSSLERTLYEGRWFRVAEFVCRAHDAGLGREEASPEPTIAFVRSGFFVKEVRGEAVVADANNVVFFDRDEPYRVQHRGGCGDECFLISLPPETVGQLLGREGEPTAGTFGRTHAPCSTRAYLLQHRLYADLLAGPPDPLRADEAVLELFDACLGPAQDGRKAETPRKSSTRLRHREVAEALKESLARDPAASEDLPTLGRRLGVAPFHLARIFRREAGMPIHRYRLRLRLRSALRRLQEGAQNLTGVALDLGFTDHSHFTNAFRAEFGTAPSRLRRGVAR